ncbi:hypothetical protein [Carnobacterium divergens]|uniref:hypothetical protein n=1 Tax=Carnobacterium divergens TaxID=2748 RepID=UPI0010728200|nr:hypothetical protein [Carnobacterium divergens]TFI75607.1 hypothetical protein CKN81_01880 [Carnobacterium divergens]
MGNIQVFEKIAPNYENDERRKIAKIIADAIRQQNPQGNQQTAIDYGCGTGLVGMESLLSNLYQSLNRNGQLLIIDFDYNEAIVSDNVHSGFKQQELIQTMKKIGFTDVKSTTFYHGSQLFMNQDASLFMLEATKN